MPQLARDLVNATFGRGISLTKKITQNEKEGQETAAWLVRRSEEFESWGTVAPRKILEC